MSKTPYPARLNDYGAASLARDPTTGTTRMSSTPPPGPSKPSEDEKPFRHPGIRWEAPRDGATTAVSLDPKGLEAMRGYLKKKHERERLHGSPHGTDR
jgi:hypothetical protein